MSEQDSGLIEKTFLLDSAKIFCFGYDKNNEISLQKKISTLLFKIGAAKKFSFFSMKLGNATTTAGSISRGYCSITLNYYPILPKPNEEFTAENGPLKQFTGKQYFDVLGTRFLDEQLFHEFIVMRFATIEYPPKFDWIIKEFGKELVTKFNDSDIFAFKIKQEMDPFKYADNKFVVGCSAAFNSKHHRESMKIIIRNSTPKFDSSTISSRSLAKNFYFEIEDWDTISNSIPTLRIFPPIEQETILKFNDQSHGYKCTVSKAGIWSYRREVRIPRRRPLARDVIETIMEEEGGRVNFVWINDDEA